MTAPSIFAVRCVSLINPSTGDNPMKNQTAIIALAAMLFAFPAGAQDDWENRRVKEIAEKAYLYAALCEGKRSSYRVCEALFTEILSDLGASSSRISPRKSIDKIRRIID